MKKALMAATLMAVAGATPANAMENSTGVDAVEDLFFSVLPEGMHDGVTVEPSGDRFEVRFDLVKMLADVGGGLYAVTSATPFVQYVSPLGDGLWRFQADQPVAFTSTLKSDAQETTTSVKVEQIRYDGVLDTAISFYRNMAVSMHGISAVSNGGPENVTVSTEALSYEIAADNLDPVALDITGFGELTGLREVVYSPKAGRVEFKAEQGKFNVKAGGVNIAALRELFGFFSKWDRQKALTLEERRRLKDMARDVLPVWRHVSEDIDLADFTLVAKDLNFTAENVHYGIGLDGILNNARYSVNLSVHKPGVPNGMLPPDLEAALPQEISFGFAVKDLELGDAVTYFVDVLDETGNQTFGPEQSARFKERLLPGGRLNVAFENIAAKSDVYDLSAEGSMTVYPEDKGRQSAHIVIYARDLDKTVTFLQQNAKLVPKFNQAAFMALMFKGFAVTEADGRLKWDIELSEQKEVRINGQIMSFPK